MQNPESEASNLRPVRRTSVPAHLAEYDLSGPGAQSQFKSASRATGLPQREHSPRSISPISQNFGGIDEVQEPELSSSPARATGGQETTCIPELSAALIEMRRDNAELRTQFQSLMTAFQAQSQSAVHQPLSQLPRSADCGNYVQRSQLQPQVNAPACQPLYYSSPRDNIAQVFSRLDVSQVPGALPNPPYYAATPQQSVPRADLYGQRSQAHSYNQRERTYRGPKPTIPCLTAPNPREFSRMKVALENLLPEDATERYKYQILTDHLKCEEASLVADSYCNSMQPYTDTMQALTKMYGQPHKLAVQRIAELMDAPNIRSGDVSSFRLFALTVRSLVGMYSSWGREAR
ncbi:unnamed protein product [Knipowitschia caucasica]